MGVKFNPLIFNGFDFTGSGGSGSSPSIGGPITGGTDGSVLFVHPNGTIAQDNTNLNFNSTTHALTVGGTISASNFSGSSSGSNTGDVTLTAVGAVPSANGASLSGQALTLQPADGTHPGLLTSGVQTIGGNKTFTGSISASNFSGSSSGTNTGDITIGTANGLSLVGQALSLGLSSTSTTGALSSTDWNTFNGKQSALTFGSISTSTTGVTVGSGTNSTVGPNVTVNIQNADATHNGLLTSTDWNTFNNGATNAANRTLSNLTTTSINADLLPTSDNTINIGSSSLRYNLGWFATNVRSNKISATNVAGSVDFIILQGSGVSLPTGGTGAAITQDPSLTSNLSLVTQNAAGSSAGIQINTGNASGGASGAITIQTGTATTTRGDVIVSGTNINLNAITQISANSKKIVNVANPTSAQDAATKSYVDGLAPAAGNFNAVAFYNSGGAGALTAGDPSFIYQLGIHSLTQGQSSSATGNNSNAFGLGAIANADGQTAVGTWNVAVGTPGSPLSTDEVFAVGVGANSGAKVTSLAVRRSGLIDAHNNLISNITDPVSAQDAATKNYVDTRTSFVTGDIGQTSFTAADNQSSPANVTGLTFSNASVRAFEAIVSIVRSSTYEVFKLRGIQKAASWEMSQDSTGDVTGITFSITTAGQVQYTSTSAGSTSLLKFRAQVLSV